MNLEQGIYKFVKIKNGDWRFWLLESGIQHRERVSEGEEVEAAGAITVTKRCWVPNLMYSTTLNIGCPVELHKEISKEIGKEKRA